MLILKMLAEFDETEIKPQQKKNQMLNKSSTLKKKKKSELPVSFWLLETSSHETHVVSGLNTLVIMITLHFYLFQLGFCNSEIKFVV